MKTLFVIITVFSIAFTSFGQANKLKKADEYYNQMSYALAADIYNDLIGSSVDTPEMKSKLAYSYFKMGLHQKAVETYSAMIESPEATSEDYYNFAAVLKMTGDYVMSDKWMQKFSEESPGDLRAEYFLDNPNYKEKIDKVSPFFKLIDININTSGTDFGGYINPAENRVYFLSTKRKQKFVNYKSSWNKSSFLDLYKVNTNPARELGAVSRVANANTKFHEGPLAFVPEGSLVYFTRSAGEENKKKGDLQRLKMYIANVDENGDFQNEREFPYNSMDYSVGHPSISKDGKTLYLVSDKPGGFGGADIYKMEILGNDEFGEMINLGQEVNTEGQEMFPFIDADNRLFFSSDGHPGLGGLDVYVALFRGAVVAEVENLGKPINSQFDDFAFTLTKDLQNGFVSSNRDGGKGGDDIYKIELIRPLVFGVLVQGKCFDENDLPIPFTLVELRDDKNRLLESTFSDENGKYSFVAEYDQTLKVKGAKQNYRNATDTLSTFDTRNIIDVDLLLEKDSGLSIHGLVTDKVTGEALEGVEVRIIDDVEEKDVKFQTIDTGGFTYYVSETMLNDKGRYSIMLSKNGYRPKTIEFNVSFESLGQYNIHTVRDLGMEPISKD